MVGKKKGGAKKPKAKKDAVIVHAADTLASFALLSLEPVRPTSTPLNIPRINQTAIFL